MTEILLILVGILSAVTVGAAFEYYRQLRKVQKEYEKARESVDDIVLSFNRQFKQEAERLELVAYRLEAISSKGDGALTKTREMEKQLSTMETKIAAVMEDREKAMARVDGVNRELRDVAASQDILTAKVTALGEQAQRLSSIPETKVEAAIPIKRDKAMAPLTNTEVAVLEMLAMEGPKTAPEIKDRIKLSREHTARLMKKLYEEGYLERDTNKIPFKYSVKKEMEKLLKKAESEAV